MKLGVSHGHDQVSNRRQMASEMASLESIKYQRGNLRILDQLLLPNECIYIDIANAKDGWHAIKKMQVFILIVVKFEFYGNSIAVFDQM